MALKRWSVGKIDAQFHPPIPNQVLTDLSQRADIRVIPFGPASSTSCLPQVPFYRPVTVEKNAFRGVLEDIIQVGVINVIVTHASVDEAIVHDMAKTIAIISTSCRK